MYLCSWGCIWQAGLLIREKVYIFAFCIEVVCQIFILPSISIYGVITYLPGMYLLSTRYVQVRCSFGRIRLKISRVLRVPANDVSRTHRSSIPSKFSRGAPNQQITPTADPSRSCCMPVSCTSTTRVPRPQPSIEDWTLQHRAYVASRPHDIDPGLEFSILRKPVRWGAHRTQDSHTHLCVRA